LPELISLHKGNFQPVRTNQADPAWQKSYTGMASARLELRANCDQDDINALNHSDRLFGEDV
jgi:hypothetical protein